MIAVATPVGHLVGLTGGEGPRHRRARRSRGLRRCAAFLIGVAVLLLAGCGPALARASDWARSPETDVRLVSAVAAVGDLPEIPLGLQFRMRPGWKIYWRSPGEGGYPPRPDWTGSENFGGASIAWPAPERFSILGIDSIGYAGEVVLPVTIRPADPGRPVHLRLALDYLTCKDICIPQMASLALTLPAGRAQPTANAHLIDRFRGRVPGPPGPDGAVERAELIEREGASALRITMTGRPAPRAPDLFVETEAGLAFGAPRPVSGAAGVVELPVLPAADRPGALVGTDIVLTVVDGARAFEQAVTVVRGVAPAAVDAGLLSALAIALLGGLILNVMPCVLPVLSIKLLAVAGQGGAAPADARRSFLATAAGIVASFLLLAAAAIAVKAAGMAVGWGIQFQQPWFLAGMTLLLLLFAANLWGLFEVPMPGWAGRLGSRGHEHGPLAGAFLTGALATLLATPCSAPFVGTAIGFALARGPGEILAIFAALGVGLALPYLAVAALPRLATKLPRPGRWMVTLRRVLGVLLVGTAVWLLTVLAAQVGLAATAAVAAIGAAMLLVLWIGRDAGARPRVAAVMLLAALAVAAPVWLRGAVTPGGAAGDPDWAAFEPARIAQLVREGRTVFVDVTADWCITCQVNKAVVLRRLPVADRLARPDVVPMRADWTRPSDEIARYLAGFGRYGIPFNAVYGPGAPEGIALPELLTGDAVLDALDRAGGETRPAPTG